MNRAWLTAYEGIGGKVLGGAEQLYYYHRRPLHLNNAGERETLDALLLDVKWMQAKLRALADPQSLIADYESFARKAAADGGKSPQALVGRALSQSAEVLARDE